MAKSRTPLLLLLLLSAAPAAADPGLAETLAERQRDELRSAMRLDCPESAPDEIVVCGSRAEEQRRHRLPMPVEGPPRAADRAGGEQRAALAVDASPCTTVGPMPRCGGGLPIFGIAATVARAIANAIQRGD